MQKMIDFSSFTPDFAAGRLRDELAAAKAAVERIENSDAADYEGFVWALNDATRALWETWGALKHMLSVMNSDAWRRVQDEFQGEVVAFSLRVGQSRPLFEKAKRLLERERETNVGGVRFRVLEHMVKSAHLAGVGLEGEKKERFNAIHSRLAKLSSDFLNAVIDSTTEEISDALYPETMKHNPDRALRERLYRLRQTRAPGNTMIISEILELRSELASLLGFGCYAEMSLSTKSAGSVKAVEEMIAKLDEASAKFVEAEHIEGEPWDIAYNAERLRERSYDYSEEELKRHFEFDDVLRGLFRMCAFLFEIEVEEMTGEAKPPVWHEDVRFFRIVEKGEEIAYFYLDPYVRASLKSGGAWMNDFAGLSRRLAIKPVATVVLNLPPKDEAGKCHLPLREVETLFHEFGHALQHMLTRVEEEDAAGINLVEWDAVEVASQFMENWCMDGRTGISVPEELKRKVKAAKNFRSASMCRRQLAFAKVDMDLHSGKPVEEPNSLKNAIFGHFNLPTISEDRFLNAFTHIFAGGYAAGYYGYKWAEVMSADCFGAFEEAGLDDDEAMKGLGRKFRDTFLSLGGSKSALEVFRLFRGRDMSVEPLLRQSGLE
jgi:oligopeptidase A